jgi:hypothetical protein
MLKECVGDHCHEGVTVKPMPGPSFEVVESEFFLELLMGLLADPTCLDGAGQRLDRRVGWQVREVVFALSTGATFPDQPSLIAGHVLAGHVVNALSRPTRDPHTHSGKARRQTPIARPLGGLLQAARRSAAPATFHGHPDNLRPPMCLRWRPRSETIAASRSPSAQRRMMHIVWAMRIILAVKMPAPVRSVRGSDEQKEIFGKGIMRS